MFTKDFDSLKKEKISQSTNKRREAENNCQQRRYHRPEVYLLGSLEKVQGEPRGTEYDGYTHYWYYP
ncbi:MAG: hypothetical protein WBM44_25065 [Waterburya sp.]